MQNQQLDALKAILMGGMTEQFLNVEVERRKGTITLPPEMSYDEGIKWLTVKRDRDEKVVAVSETIVGFPLDVVHALFVAIDRKYGYSEAKTQMTFFGPKPPQFMAVPIDHQGNTVDVLVGPFELPGIEGQLSTQAADSCALLLNGKVKHKHLPEVKALAALTREILKTDSLYKGKAIKLDSQVMAENGMVMPQFMDTSVGHANLVLNRDVAKMLEANVWNPIRYMDRCIEYGTPVRRGVAFAGDYGTGKTLAANKTAAIANDFGWTYFYCQRADDLIYVYNIARQFQPAVVFCEDVDRINPNLVHTLSTTLDGVDTKGSQILLVLTSNHIQNVPPIIMRSGRIDMSIYFSLPDRDTIVDLVRIYATDLKTGRSLLAHDLEWKPVIDALIGMTPATIREVVEQSKLSAIATLPLLLGTEDIVFTAQGLKRHAALSVLPVKEKTPAELLAESLHKVVNQDIEKEQTEHDLDELYQLTDAVDDRTRMIHRTVGQIGAPDYSSELEKIQDTVDAIRDNQ